ncbi:4524_t:CDS:2, partial [Acaulospora colombiana]
MKGAVNHNYGSVLESHATYETDTDGRSCSRDLQRRTRALILIKRSPPGALIGGNGFSDWRFRHLCDDLYYEEFFKVSIVTGWRE